MLQVASGPASHVYVRHLAQPAGVDAVRRLSDPVPRDGRKVPGGRWPPLMLEPGWVTENRDRFDVFHVHFGFDAIAPEDLREVVGELKRHNKPLVYNGATICATRITPSAPLTTSSRMFSSSPPTP